MPSAKRRFHDFTHPGAYSGSPLLENKRVPDRARSAIGCRHDRRSEFQADLSEVPPRFLIAKGVGDLRKREASVDNRSAAAGIERAHHYQLMAATPGHQTLKPRLLCPRPSRLHP